MGADSLKILLIGAGGLKTALREQGHDVLHVGPGRDCEVILKHPITL